MNSTLNQSIYTAENPRRSKRKVEYYTEQDEIADAIDAICTKRGWEFSQDLITEFEAWLPTADKFSSEKYDYHTATFIPRTKLEMAEKWALYYSNFIQEKKNQLKITKTIINYCKKHGLEYNPLMVQKFAEWKADPANKNHVIYTFTTVIYNGTAWNAANLPNGVLESELTKIDEEQTARSPAECVNKWFSTLKKTVIF